MTTNTEDHGFTPAAEGPFKRACGYRVAGGIYMTCDPAPPGEGMPLEWFLFDSPITDVMVGDEVTPVADAYGLTALGVRLVRDPSGTWHVFDVVGRDNYPHAADFHEECRRRGPSRKLSPGLDYSLLDQDSRMVFVHPWGHVEDRWPYYEAEDEIAGWSRKPCPKDAVSVEHEAPDEGDDPPMCARYAWQDLTEGTPANPGIPRQVRRVVGDVSYEAFLRPDGARPEYRPAMVSSFPISRLEVIRARDGRHEDAARKAGAAGVPVSLEDF